MNADARAAWLHNARGLGLEPCLGPNMLRLHAGNALVYGQLKQMVVPATSPVEPPGWAFWARGAWGVEVMAGIPYGSGGVLGLGGSGASTQTVVLARIDPPLFLGLRELDPDLAARVFSMPLRVEAALPAQAKAMGDRLAEEGFRAYDSARRRGADVSIADTYVLLAFPALVAGDVLRSALNDASVLAAALVRARLAAAPHDIQRLYVAWKEFAEERGLAFDHDRYVVQGTFEGVDVSIHVYASHGEGVVDVGAELARPIDARVTIGREGRRSWLERHLDRDVEVGDELFDKLALVRGEPDEDTVRAVLTEKVRDALLEVLDWAGGVTIGGGAVWAHADVVPVTKPALERVLTEIAATAKALCPTRDAASPYR